MKERRQAGSDLLRVGCVELRITEITFSGANKVAEVDDTDFAEPLTVSEPNKLHFRIIRIDGM